MTYPLMDFSLWIKYSFFGLSSMALDMYWRWLIGKMIICISTCRSYSKPQWTDYHIVDNALVYAEVIQNHNGLLIESWYCGRVLIDGYSFRLWHNSKLDEETCAMDC